MLSGWAHGQKIELHVVLCAALVCNWYYIYKYMCVCCSLNPKSVRTSFDWSKSVLTMRVCKTSNAKIIKVRLG